MTTAHGIVGSVSPKAVRRSLLALELFIAVNAVGGAVWGLAGLVLVGWITIQVLIIVPEGGFSWLQPTMFGAGLLVAALGRRLRQPIAG